MLRRDWLKLGLGASVVGVIPVTEAIYSEEKAASEPVKVPLDLEELHKRLGRGYSVSVNNYRITIHRGGHSVTFRQRYLREKRWDIIKRCVEVLEEKING